VRDHLPITPDDISILKIEGLSHQYGEIELFRDLAFNLHKREIRVVLGPSGSGKTTLLHLVAGLLRLQAGQICWLNKPIANLSEEALARLRLTYTGLVFQHHYLQSELTALENVLVPGYLVGQVDTAWGLELLEKVGLAGRAKLLPKALSGGERQRVAVARALYNRPQLLIADEPTGSLDRVNAEKVLKLMLELASTLHTAVLIATHDEHLVKGLPELRLE
jgi:lipoprotein-releasing system ATP-binding protein